MIIGSSGDKNQSFDKRLRAERERLKLSQAQLAERAGLQASAISHFETGARRPSFRSLRKLAVALGVTTDYLLGRTEARTESADTVDAIARDIRMLSAEDLELTEQFVARLRRASGARGESDDGEAEG